jgi:outer membrane protein assembly factor BamB
LYSNVLKLFSSISYFTKFRGKTKMFAKSLMKNSNHNYTIIATTMLILLVSSSAFIMFSNSAVTVKAQTTTVPNNMLQYEWVSPAADAERSFFSAGPAPDTPSIQWKTKIPGVSSCSVAFGGLVFVQALGTTYALDGGTGKIVWSILEGGGICKIDNTYMVIGSKCVYIADGSTVWTGPAGFAYGQNTLYGGGYVPELKMFVDESLGWSLPDPSQPPTLEWNRTAEENVDSGYSAYGDGKVFIGSNDGFLRGVNATTGALIWTTPATTNFIYGMTFADGKLFHGGLDNNMRCWDANTGKLLWTYNPHTWYGQWASAIGNAYGMIYGHNQDTYVYAINATTGQLVWRQKGPGIVYSDILSIADGKVYVQMGDSQYRDPETGVYGYSEFDCYDAYTGQLIWALPLEDGAPFNLQCIAYGNLYLLPTVSAVTTGQFTYSMGGYGAVNAGSLGEVWCIGSTIKDWSMFMNDPAHTAEGAGPTALSLKWKFPTGANVISSPTAANGVVYFGSLDSKIYAVDASSGTQKWAFETNFPVASSPAVANGKVYTGADDGNIYCLDAATGSQLWKTNAGGVTNCLLNSGFSAFPVRCSPMVSNGKVYAGALDGNLYCVDAKNGKILWTRQTGGPILATPTIDDNSVYVASCTQPINGKLCKLDASTGAVIWNIDVPYVLNRTLWSGNFLFASPTVADGMVFLRNGLLYNYAFNATTGATVWTYAAGYNPGTPGQSGGVIQGGAPLYAYGVIYINDYYSISALNATNGVRIWSTYLSREDLSQAITYSYGRLYVVNQAGVFYVLDAYTGAKLSYYEFGTVQIFSAPMPYNGSVYVGANDWNLYCFGDARIMSAASTEPPASPTPTTGLTTNPTATSTIQATATPTQTTSQSPQVTQQPTKEVSNDIYLVIAVAVVIVVVIAIAAIFLRKRK